MVLSRSLSLEKRMRCRHRHHHTVPCNVPQTLSTLASWRRRASTSTLPFSDSFPPSSRYPWLDRHHSAPLLCVLGETLGGPMFQREGRFSQNFQSYLGHSVFSELRRWWFRNWDLFFQTELRLGLWDIGECFCSLSMIDRLTI